MSLLGLSSPRDIRILPDRIVLDVAGERAYLRSVVRAAARE
jgi:hypothetical protein